MKAFNALMIMVLLVVTSNAMAQWDPALVRSYQGEWNLKLLPDKNFIEATAMADEIVTRQRIVLRAQGIYSHPAFHPDTISLIEKWIISKNPRYASIFPKGMIVQKSLRGMSGKASIPAMVAAGTVAVGVGVGFGAYKTQGICDEGQTERCGRLQRSARSGSAAGAR